MLSATRWNCRSSCHLAAFQNDASTDAEKLATDMGYRMAYFEPGVPSFKGYPIGFPGTVFTRQKLLMPRTAPMPVAARAIPIFLAPPWREIYETDQERKQDFAEAERTFVVLAEVYRRCGYELVELPRLPPQARARFILDRPLRLDTIAASLPRLPP